MMAHQESVTGTGLRTPRAAAAWGELLFPAWILLLSIDILWTGLRSSRGAGDTAIDTAA